MKKVVFSVFNTVLWDFSKVGGKIQMKIAYLSISLFKLFVIRGRRKIDI